MLTPYALGWLIIVLCVPVLILVGLLLALRPGPKTRKGTRPPKTTIKLGEFQIETTSAGIVLVALGILLLAIITGTKVLPTPDFSSLSWPQVTFPWNQTPVPTLTPTGAQEVVTVTPRPPTPTTTSLPTATPPPPQQPRAPTATPLPPAPTATFTPAPPTRIPPVELPPAPTPTQLPSGGKP
jgi:hypothetical protein